MCPNDVNTWPLPLYVLDKHHFSDLVLLCYHKILKSSGVIVGICSFSHKNISDKNFGGLRHSLCLNLSQQMFSGVKARFLCRPVKVFQCNIGKPCLFAYGICLARTGLRPFNKKKSIPLCVSKFQIVGGLHHCDGQVSWGVGSLSAGPGRAQLKGTT